MHDVEEQEAQIRKIRGMRKLTAEQFDALVGMLSQLELDVNALKPLERDRRVAVNVQLTPEDWHEMQLRALEFGIPASQVVRLLVLSWLGKQR